MTRPELLPVLGFCRIVEGRRRRARQHHGTICQWQEWELAWKARQWSHPRTHRRMSAYRLAGRTVELQVSLRHRRRGPGRRSAAARSATHPSFVTDLRPDFPDLLRDVLALRLKLQ